MTFLVDVNLLIALMDPDHIAHDLAHGWFEREGAADWATCPIIQNGVIRIVGSASYANVPLGCDAVAEILASWCASPEHQFWSDDISLLTAPYVDRSKLLSPGRITDSYLLALAVSREGRLATLDRRLSPIAVEGGAAALHLIN